MSTPSTIQVTVGESVEQAEKRLIVATLGHEPNKTKAAAMLGVSLKTLYNRLHEYGLADAYVQQPGRRAA